MKKLILKNESMKTQDAERRAEYYSLVEDTMFVWVFEGDETPEYDIYSDVRDLIDDNNRTGGEFDGSFEDAIKYAEEKAYEIYMQEAQYGC